MATQKKKSTRTASKKTVAAKTHKKVSTRTTRKTKGIEPREKWHVYIVTSLSIITAILLTIDAAIMIVA